MSRRVKTFDPLRPNYYGKPICTKEEFINKFLTDAQFLALYKKWQDAGFTRAASPAIDRINNNLGYTLDNLEFISHRVNSTKDVVEPVIVYKNGQIIAEFSSQAECAKALNIHRSSLCNKIKSGKLIRKEFLVVKK